MNDLIDRIRAYVAAIPTHRCDGCALDFTSETMTCPSCGTADRTRWVADSEANRLLREVAALRPKAFLVHDGRAFVDAAYTDGGYAMKQLAHRRDGAILSLLYTLTGDSHAPE